MNGAPEILISFDVWATRPSANVGLDRSTSDYKDGVIYFGIGVGTAGKVGCATEGAA
jgi:hypothetical protein